MVLLNLMMAMGGGAQLLRCGSQGAEGAMTGRDLDNTVSSDLVQFLLSSS